MSLRTCSACDRHVRVSEASCPFCGASIAMAERPTEKGAAGVGWAGRAALLFGAAATVAGCTSMVSAYGCPDPTCEGPPRDDAGVDVFSYTVGSDSGAADAATDGAADTSPADGAADSAKASDAGDAAVSADGAPN